ncbi:MAG TPA: glycerophosphodiester phosphodiesterase family protein [Candidatus Saccharimonadales bacterium]|nr:glycerophosphodiester phosphodiesterase family protein [Candidatus Saccharimonadales bacterium]
MFIIGHRGAAGIAPENTLESIDMAKKNKANAIEIDIRVTKDNKPAVFHDESLLRMTGVSKQINELTMQELKKIKLVSGDKIPTLEEALERAGNTPLVIEGKGNDWAEPLSKVLNKHKGVKPMVISYNQRELLLFSSKRKNIETYAIEDHRAFEVMALAKRLGIDGVSLAFWLYNPLTYLHAKRLGLKLITSPINNRLTVKVFNLLYPQVQITTDYPNRFKNRKNKK